MRISIDAATCMGNGLCESIAPELFGVGEDAIARAIADPATEADRAAAGRAARMCPTRAIDLEDET